MKEPSKSYSIEKLNESNYRSWSQVIESHLDDQDLWEVVQGIAKQPVIPTTSTETEQPDTTAMTKYAEELEAWNRKTKRERKLIVSTISPSVMMYVEGTKDPAEMWK